MAIKLSGLASGMDTESMVSELMSAQRMKSTKIENKRTKAEWKLDKWKDLNKKLYSFYTGSLSKMKLQGNFSTKAAASSDASKVAVTASSNATEGTHKIKVNSLASAQFVTGAALGSTVTESTTLSSLGAGTGDITLTNGTTSKTLTVTATTTISDLVSTMKSAGINASFDATQKRLYLGSKASGTDSAFSLTAAGTIDLSKVGLISFNSGTTEGPVTLSGGSTMAFVSAKNASFDYNGAAMTSSSNSVTANGLTFNLLATTGTDTISVNVTNDTKAVYDKVKSFIKEYNALTKEMNELYSADSAKGYEPLTDDQKKAMSADQVTKWEDKIKNSLLRRDNNISSLLNTMRSNMSESVTYKGKAYSLSSFGIKTADYTEKGLLHIAGDEDDSTVSAEENKLMKALTDEPDAVMETMTALAGKLYTSYTNDIKSSSLRSALSFYNDKEVRKQIDDYSSELITMEDKLSSVESRYYKQFSAMEKAMSKMNSQSSYFSSMLGTK